MPSIKIVLMLSAIVLSVYLVDNCAGNPYPSIGKGKSKRLGNFCLLLLFSIVSDFVNILDEKLSRDDGNESLWKV